MRKWIGILFLMSFAILSGCATRQGNTSLLKDKIAVSEKSEYYKVQLEALVRDSISVIPYTNWRQFRVAFFQCKLENPQYFGNSSKASIDLMMAKQGGYQEQYAQIAYNILEHDYTSISAHNELANNLSIYPKTREFHAAVRDALLKSIMNSGDGLSPETAIHVISVAEEYEFMFAMGYSPNGQTLLHKGGKHYDVIKVFDAEGNMRDIYFDINTFYGMFY